MAYGGIIQRIDTNFQNGVSSDLFGVQNKHGIGVYHAPISFFECIPATAATIAIAQTTVANTAMALNPALTTLVNGVTVVPLDCQRNVTFNGTAGANFGVAGTFTIVGYTEDFQKVTNVVAFGAGVATISSSKTFKYIYSITPSVTTTPTVTAVSGLNIALPWYLSRAEFVVQAWYNGTHLARNLITVGNNWRTTAPSSTTNDATGFVSLTGIYNAGSLLTVAYYVYGADSYLQAECRSSVTNNGTLNRTTSSQTIIYNNTAQAPLNNIPVLTAADMTGVNFTQ